MAEETEIKKKLYRHKSNPERLSKSIEDLEKSRDEALKIKKDLLKEHLI